MSLEGSYFIGQSLIGHLSGLNILLCTYSSTIIL
jgi:hypothetical protein